MGTGLVSFRRERVARSAPAWVEVTERHICDGSRPRADMLLIRPTGGPGRCRRPRRTSPHTGHAEAARSWMSHVGSPAPSLLVLHPGAPQRHSQIVAFTGSVTSRSAHTHLQFSVGLTPHV